MKDTLPPTLPSLLSPISGVYLNTGTAPLRWSASTETGVGFSGYVRQLSTGVAFTTIYMSGVTLNTGLNILALPDTIYYRRVLASDLNNNTGSRTNGQSFVVDTTLPTIIFTGATPATNAIA